MRTLGDAIDTSLWNVGYGQAGKNKIINGDFSVWQRGTSFTSPSFSAYLADRFRNNNYDFAPTTYSFTQQTFTPGTAPVAGYEGQFFARSTITTVGSNTQYDTFCQKVENVRTFAGQTATLSFWAKSDSTRTQQIYVGQNFGSGGSSEVTVNAYGTNNFVTTTAWQRFTLTLSIPSISGKTIGTSSFLYEQIRQVSASGSVLDLWGVQWEYGSVATPFQTATGTIQGELAACQRYYYQAKFVVTARYGVGSVNDATSAQLYAPFPVPMRVRPTALETSGTAGDYSLVAAGATTVCSAVPSHLTSFTEGAGFTLTVASGLTAGQAALLRPVNTSAYLGWSAEL
jgi:hypothetical protein